MIGGIGGGPIGGSNSNHKGYEPKTLVGKILSWIFFLIVLIIMFHR